MNESGIGSGQLATEVLRKAWRTYRGHLGTIVGLSLVGAVQRPVVVAFGELLPAPVSIGLEVVVWAARAALVALLVRWIVLDEERLRGVGIGECARRVLRYARRHPQALVLQLVGFAAVFALFDTVPDRVVAPLVPAHAVDAYWMVVLAVKNPTVIAFTFVWEIALLHQALIRGAEQQATVAAR